MIPFALGTLVGFLAGCIVWPFLMFHREPEPPFRDREVPDGV